jgi:hypothetical protein
MWGSFAKIGTRRKAKEPRCADKQSDTVIELDQRTSNPLAHVTCSSLLGSESDVEACVSS